MKRIGYWFLIGMAGLFPLQVSVSQGSEPGKAGTVPLLENLGDHHYPISTSVPLAQAYFNQGLIQSFGFNHAEAARSFKEAQRQDPGCAMCLWGEALVLGPNINAPMNPAVGPLAYSTVQKAIELSSEMPEKEQRLIRALSVRYSKEVMKDRRTLDEAYANAMRSLWKAYPDDSVVGALLAEALMDLHPWDFWNRRGQAKPWTPEIVSVLETVIAKDSGNPLAHHLYIHVMEASPHPDKAIPSAELLPGLVPGSGHLVHMPAHIWIRVGRYQDAVAANQRAVKVDEHYLNHNHEESIYTAAYVPHNFHFLWAAAVKTGQQKLAMQAASDAASKVSPEMMRDPALGGTLQHFWLLPLYTQALFGEWSGILKMAEPPSDLAYPRAILRYARGLALVRHGKIEEAQTELTHLKRIEQDPVIAELTIFDVNKVASLLRIAEAILAGEIALKLGDHDASIDFLNTAVQIEDGLNYTEPKDWYLPSRQVLGAILLETGNASEAERIFREDLEAHPQNGWSLFGLVQSLRLQGKSGEADTVQEMFAQAWAEADVSLPSSRF